MSIRINSPIKISNTKSVINQPEKIKGLGQIMRVFNSGSVQRTYEFLNIFGDNVSTTLSANQISYIMVLSGSRNDNWDSTNQIITTNLLITGSELGNTFTEELFTTPGAGTWTKPVGVTEVIVECWGAGGAGGGSTTNNTLGGGGGGGGYARSLINYTAAQQNISYNVGQGGVAGTGNGPSGTNTTWQSTIVVANGGSGGQSGPNGGNGGVGGGAENSSVPNTGSIVYFGGNGAFGGSLQISSGGSGAGSAQNGEIPNTFTFIVAPGGKEYGGDGADTYIDPGINFTGLPGNNYGGGGSGAWKISGANRSGGNGAQGLIRIIYR